MALTPRDHTCTRFHPLYLSLSQGVDVVATFPSSASESSVLWFKSKIESVPGLVVTTRPISIMEGKKTKQCYAFQITATYQGYGKKHIQYWLYGF